MTTPTSPTGGPSSGGTDGDRRAVVTAGHTGDLDLVRAFADDPRAELRRAALGALARLGVLDDDRLLTALADPEGAVRRRAVELAGRRPVGDRVRGRLVAALDDEPAVAEAAAFALGEHERADDDVVAALVRTATDHDDALCREAAVAALGAIGAGLAVVLQALSTDRATVRRRAVLALAAFEGPAVDAALRRSLEDRDWQVRQAAEDLLAP